MYINSIYVHSIIYSYGLFMKAEIENSAKKSRGLSVQYGEFTLITIYI